MMLLLACVWLGGCSPVSVQLTLFADSAKLVETTVEADRNYGENKVALIDVRGLIAERSEAGLFSNGSSSVDELACRLKL